MNQTRAAGQDDELLETTEEAPEGFDIQDLPERSEEFAPGLTPELMELVRAAAEMAPKGNGNGMAHAAATSSGTTSSARRKKAT